MATTISELVGVLLCNDAGAMLVLGNLQPLDFVVQAGHDEVILGIFPAASGTERTVSDLLKAFEPFEMNPGGDTLVDKETTPIDVDLRPYGKYPNDKRFGDKFAGKPVCVVSWSDAEDPEED